eukprot:10550_3
MTGQAAADSRHTGVASRVLRCLCRQCPAAATQPDSLNASLSTWSLGMAAATRAGFHRKAISSPSAAGFALAV